MIVFFSLDIFWYVYRISTSLNIADNIAFQTLLQAKRNHNELQLSSFAIIIINFTFLL